MSARIASSNIGCKDPVRLGDWFISQELVDLKAFSCFGLPPRFVEIIGDTIGKSNAFSHSNHSEFTSVAMIARPRFDIPPWNLQEDCSTTTSPFSGRGARRLASSTSWTSERHRRSTGTAGRCRIARSSRASRMTCPRRLWIRSSPTSHRAEP